MPRLDDEDRQIIAERVARLDAVTGPRVGDFVDYADGVTHRISFLHDDLAQTSQGGSWYLSEHGIQCSAAMDPGVPPDRLTTTGQTRPGSVWIFHHNHRRAHNGVQAEVPFRVYRTAWPVRTGTADKGANMSDAIIDTAALRVLADLPAPLIGVDNPHHEAYDTGTAVRDALRAVRAEAAHQYAAHLANTAARILRRTFGPTAHRAVLERRDTEDAAIAMDLLVVFDAHENVIWYDRDSLWGTHLVAARDEIAAYGGPAVPLLDQPTKEAIEGLCELAEDAPSGGYFVRCYLPTAPGQPYDGWVVELNIADESNRLRRLVGPPAPDGSAGPQRRLLTPHERALTTQVLRTVVSALMNHRDRPIRSAVRVSMESRLLLLGVAAVLDPRDPTDQPTQEDAPAARYERVPVSRLAEGDLFSVDAHAWYVCAVPPGDLFDPELWAVPVYASARRDKDAPTIRLDVPTHEVYIYAA